MHGIIKKAKKKTPGISIDKFFVQIHCKERKKYTIFKYNFL